MRHPTPGKGREGRGSPVEGAKFKPGYFPHLITHPTSRLHDRTGASRSPSTSVQRTHQRQKGLHRAPRAKRGWSRTALAPGTHSTQLFHWHTSPILFSCCPLNHFFLDPKMLSAEAGFLGNRPAQWFQVKALPLLLLLPLLTEEMVCEQNLGENS